MTREKASLYTKAFEVYGETNQMIVAIEELSEMQKELTKVLRDKGNLRNLAQEIADAEIMIEQIKLMFCISEAVIQWKSIKLKRLESRLEEEEKNEVHSTRVSETSDK